MLHRMLNKSVQAQFLVPMAVSLAFGVLFATVVTLLVVPSAYLILHDLGNVINKVRGRGRLEQGIESR